MNSLTSNPSEGGGAVVALDVCARAALLTDIPRLVRTDRHVPPGDRWSGERHEKQFTQQGRFTILVEEVDTRDILIYLAGAERDEDLVLFRMVASRSDFGPFFAQVLYDWAYKQAQEGQKKYLTTWTRESNLDMQMFLKKQGFFCQKIIPNYYKNPGEPCYYFRRPVLQDVPDDVITILDSDSDDRQ